ncbi:12201_t:CDS:2 [Funneliformis mosseae]|uniref:12201_t:CDS:1 n=1 Tax=Funneliformis mosseae TaxID=27381 RepID=A0A9N9FS29_FUNMO|nr:12201_t:CDS:2 [Funneliformis mosseae]
MQQAWHYCKNVRTAAGCIKPNNNDEGNPINPQLGQNVYQYSTGLSL